MKTIHRPRPLAAVLGVTLSLATAGICWADDDHEFKIKEAKWKAEESRLTVKGKGSDEGLTVTVSNADGGALIGTDEVDDDNKWKVREYDLASVPCRVRAVQSDGQSKEKDVEDAPSDCDSGGVPPGNVPPTANANGPYNGTTTVEVNFSSAGSTDPDGNIVSYAWDFGDGGSSSAANPKHAYMTAGTYSVSLTVTDNDGARSNDSTTASITDTPSDGGVSINSTSLNGVPYAPVPEQPIAGNTAFKVFGTNDLGMHCGDLDTRISSILPPFNVLHAQVIQRGGDPSILTPADGIDVVYSAASNPADPILSGQNSAGTGPVLWSTLADGSVYKTNFWDRFPAGAAEPTALATYRAFYPPGILDAFYPNGGADIQGVGLPMPNTERLYLGDGQLTAEQQTMPGNSVPYTANVPQSFRLFTVDQPFFTGFPFGYVATDVNWFEAAGVPATAFDDFGRENPWPLFRIQAKDSGGTVLASSDVVVPISGEANCGFCHNAPIDGGNGAATKDLTKVATTLDDPQLDGVPLEISKEYAADLNLLRLHDQKHGTNLLVGTTLDEPPGNIEFKPVICQTCHYTPALDLAQVGPKGPEHADANGRQQTNVKSMSNVMHSHHATVTDVDGNPLFPDMPPAVDANGNLRDPVAARDILMDTCYQCHPGRRTDCLRGAMASGGMLCQDCHGQMAQVGNDFSKNVSPTNSGLDKFIVADDFYDPNSSTPRVPWGNEPGCGSCHTGDAMDNLHSAGDTLGSIDDNIRLMQAYRIGDSKATPIVPSNKRFAENTVPANGNPMLYRVSTGHEGVFCEACHGATHGIWPNKNPGANDNVAAQQLQGHSGVIIECDTCHTGDLGVTLDGPHGMHPVGNAGDKFADGGHEDLAEKNPDACRACHGQNGEGTVLSTMHQDRMLNTDDNGMQLFQKGHQVTCTDCHSNKL